MEDAFKSFTTRDDIAVLLISQQVPAALAGLVFRVADISAPQIADDLRHLLEEYDQVVPTILEIPTKNHPYDPSKDFMMSRLKKMLGSRD